LGQTLIVLNLGAPLPGLLHCGIAIRSMTVHLKTAKAIGIELPTAILLRAKGDRMSLGR
jgi:hypothetical protein